MKQFINKQWKRMLALMLIIAMTSTYLLTDYKVARAENTSVTFSLANSNEQDGEGRYLIVLNVQGMTVPNAATGWDNTVYLDGVEKTGVEGSGLAYSYCGSESQMYLLLQYDFVESGARTASSIGKHEIVIPEGTRISFGSVTMELTKDFAIYINGSTVFSSAITHTYSSVTGTKKGDNGNFLRFKVTDSLETQGSALVILDGGLYKNGVLIAKDAYDIQKPWADAYHIGLDKGKLTFDVGDRLRMDVLVVSATDTTYSYAIKFEIIFECTSTTDAGSTTATWSWSVVEPEPELPQPAITHTYSSVTGTKKGDNGNFLRFKVTDSLETQGSALVILDGGLYKNGVLIAKDAYDIQKPWADAYHIGLDKGKLTFDVEDRLRMDVLVVSATDTTYSYAIKFEIIFECTSTTDAGSTTATWSWSVVEPEPELPQPAITHIYSSVTRTKKGDNGNFLRFAVEDTLGAQTSALVILDGGLYKNGVLIAEDAYDIQKPWADAYHIGLDKGKLTFDIGDELTMDVLAVAATDITYSYPIKFEIIFECTSTTDAGSTTATWSWSVVEPEPELPQPAITHTYSSVTSTKKGDHGNFLRFKIMDSLEAQGSALVILEGGLYKNGELLEENTYDIQKPWADAYHIGLDKGYLTFDVGDELTMDVLVVAATDTTFSYPIRFEITFECTSATDADDVSATWKWSVVQRDIYTELLNDDERNTVNCTRGLYFVTTNEDELEYSLDWNERYVMSTGNIYVNGEEVVSAELVKITKNLYYIVLEEYLASSDATLADGTVVTVSGTVEDQDYIVEYATTSFVYHTDTGWSITDYCFKTDDIVLCLNDSEPYYVEYQDTKIDDEKYSIGTQFVGDSGTYSLVYVNQKLTYKCQLILYKIADVNISGDIATNDLIALKKMFTSSENYENIKKISGDINANGAIGTDDVNLMRNILVENELLVLCPAENDVVAEANPVVATLVNNYDYTAYKSESLKNKTDLYHRESVILRWMDYEENAKYTVHVSEHVDMSAPVEYTSSTQKLELINLLPNTTYYWTVSKDGTTSNVASFVTADTIRTLTIDGVSNTRDIGGYVTEGGARVKYGMVFRGANIDGVTEIGKQQLIGDLKVKTDLDLRGENVSSPLGESVNYYSYSAPAYWDDGRGLWTEGFREALCNSIKVFANEDNYPIYYHCQIGRDRTGSMTLLINGLLGVNKSDLFMDYEMSFLSTSGSADNALTEHMVTIFNDMYNGIQAYAPNETFADACEAFLLDRGVSQTDIDSIRRIMLEDE